MAEEPFPNRSRADSALLIYLNAMQGYIASIFERAHGQDWARSQLLTEKLEKRDWGEYERRRLALDAGKDAQHLIDFPVLSQLIDDNRKTFGALRTDDVHRVHSIRDLRNELFHPDPPRDCPPDLVSAIVMFCTRTLKRCGQHGAVKDIEHLSSTVPANADVTPDIDRREYEDWLRSLPSDSIPEGITPRQYDNHLKVLWDEEKELRGRERDEIAEFGGDIDGLRRWFDADSERHSRHKTEYAELQERERLRLEQERSEIAEFGDDIDSLREWFGADSERPSRHEPEHAELQERERLRLEQERSEIAELLNGLREWFDADEGRHQRHRLEYSALIRTKFERSSLTEKPSSSANARLGAGSHHSVALSKDGSVICWGDNSKGKRDAPTGRFVAVSAGSEHSIALREDGTVVCWGDNEFGQRNDAPTTGQFVAVSAGDLHNIALREDGTVVCWGDNDSGQRDDAPTTGQFVAVSAGGFHSVALSEDGTVVCWGDNKARQRDDAPTTGQFVAVSAGGFHSVALSEDGTVVCWGDDTFDQCGDAPTTGQFVAVSAGFRHSIALRGDGTVVCWGDNNARQRDDAPTTGQFAAVSAGREHSIAQHEDGMVVCWGGDNESDELNAPPERLWVPERR